jgi:hypothetical protein
MVLGIGDHAVMNMGVQIYLQDSSLILLGMFPEVELLDHMIILLLFF